MANPFEINNKKYEEKRSAEEKIANLYSENRERHFSDQPSKIERGERLNFTYEYADGTKLEASEQENGEILITFTKDGAAIDLKSYLPAGGRIVTKNYNTDHMRIEEDVKYKKFSSNRTYNIVFVNQISDPKDILVILHEMGHVLIHKDEKQKQKESKDEFQKALAGTDPKLLTQEALSKEERSAWFEAIRLVRRLKKEDNINVLEVFDSWEDFQKFMYFSLTRYRYIGELSLVKSDFKTWVQSFFGPVISQEEREFMSHLFDKKLLSRKFGNL